MRISMHLTSFITRSKTNSWASSPPSSPSATQTNGITRYPNNPLIHKSINPQPTMLFTSIDFDKPGKQQGFLQVPYSHDLAGWANLLIPITCISRGQGPTVLVLAGNHGDEYQGQI